MSWARLIIGPKSGSRNGNGLAKPMEIIRGKKCELTRA